MKLEMGESLMVSWLRHIKQCQLVQSNWKISSQWQQYNLEKINDTVHSLSEFYNEVSDAPLFKKNAGTQQILKQAEIDVLGLSVVDNKIFAIDIAFHENGLNYGAKMETIVRVVKKCLRSALCAYGIFPDKQLEIIFASPKVSEDKLSELQPILSKAQDILNQSDMSCTLRLICNNDFKQEILEPVIGLKNDIADTSELFMRSIQLYSLFSEPETRMLKVAQSPELALIGDKSQQASNLDQCKVGTLANIVLRSVLQKERVTQEEVELLQNLKYCKELFKLQFPILLKTCSKKREARYYKELVTIHGEHYRICSEWLKRNKPNLIQWLFNHGVSNYNLIF